MSQRKIGTFALAAMLVGAILGSGIIILPPLVLDAAGGWSLAAWGLTALFGVAFGYVFAHIGTVFPGDGGAAVAVERAFGPGAKRLAAYALACATLFGPAAVMLTITDYLPAALAPETPMGRFLTAGTIQVTCAGLILSGLRNMSRIGVALAVTATGLLLAGAAMVLGTGSPKMQPLPAFDGSAMGYALLLLFWAVVGWEIVGNYAREVTDPKRTMPRAAILAGLVIGLVFMAVAAGLQLGAFPPQAGHGVAALLHPLFGQFAPWVMAALVAALCVTTYLMFVGGVSRLVAHMADDGALPSFLSRRNRFGVPSVVMACYTAAHVGQIGLASADVLDVAGILAISDGFFLVNALLGTLAAVKLFDRRLPKLVAVLLSLGVFAVLTQAHWPVLASIGVMTACIFARPGRRRALGNG